MVERGQLVAGGSVRARLAAGEGYRYRLRVSGPSFVAARLEQAGVDLLLALETPSGQVIASADGPGGTWMSERLSALSEAPPRGLFLTVRPKRAGGAGSAYLLRLDAARHRGPDDAERVAIDALLQRGGHLQKPVTADSFAEAEMDLSEAAARAAAIGDLPRQLSAALLRGTGAVSQGRYDEARPLLEEALTAARQLGDRAAQVEASGLLAEAFVQEGAVAAAQDLLAGALAIAKQLGETDPLVATLRRVGETAYGRGDRQEAQARLEAGLRVCAQEGCNLHEELLLATDLGVVQRSLGRFQEALELYRRAAELASRLGDDFNRAMILNNLGVLHRARGELHAALASYREALELALRVRRPSTEASASSNLGALYTILGDLDRALVYQQRSLALYREMDSQPGETTALMELGWLLDKLGRSSDAARNLEAAVARSRVAGLRSTETYALVGLGRAYGALGRTEEARARLAEGRAVAEELRDLPGQIEALQGVAEIALGRGELASAEAALDPAVDLAISLGDAWREAGVRTLRARLFRARGDLDGARRELELALGLLESLRAAVSTVSLRSSFQARELDAYLDFVDLLVERARAGSEPPQAAFAAAERAKARTFVELLAEAQVDLTRDASPALLARRGQLTALLGAKRAEQQRRRADSGSDDAGLAASLADLEGALDRVEGELRRMSPRYGDLRYPAPVAVADVQSLLGSDTALLEYVLAAGRSHLFVLTRDQLTMFELGPRSDLAAATARLRAAVQTRGRARQGHLQSAQTELFDLLLRPALPALATRTKLVVVPDQELCYLPFELLEDGEDPARTLALERWAIAYVPSAAALARLHARGREPTAAGLSFVGFADPTLPSAPTGALGPALPGLNLRPLPAARREVTAIAAGFPRRQTALFLGAAADEAVVKEDPAVRDARRLHFAGHALLDAVHPADSALLLAADPRRGEDGLLRVHEIFDLELRADLVVLSGCETALGREVRGEGFVGMTQAFFYAGAQSLLVSLWAVPDDSTAELMIQLYGELQRATPPAEALRRAKLSLLREAPYRHPYSWAPFVLVGLGG